MLYFLHNSVVHSDFIFDFVFKPSSSFSASEFEISVDTMANNNQSLKELATLDVVYQSWCIQYREIEVSYELKSGLIHLLPKFHGLASEDPHKHLKEFHVVCSTMRQHDIHEDYVEMKTFPFFLDDVAKDWLYLRPDPMNT